MINTIDHKRYRYNKKFKRIIFSLLQYMINAYLFIYLKFRTVKATQDMAHGKLLLRHIRYKLQSQTRN